MPIVAIKTANRRHCRASATEQGLAEIVLNHHARALRRIRLDPPERRVIRRVGEIACCLPPGYIRDELEELAAWLHEHDVLENLDNILLAAEAKEAAAVFTALFDSQKM